MKLRSLVANGTLIWYYYICKREVWLIAHGIEPPQDNELISIGRLIHESFYKKFKKELFVDGKIKIDIVEGKKAIGEIKKSSKYLKSAKMQLAFYLFYLKTTKGKEIEGELLIPEERKRIKVKLTPELEKEIEKAVFEIEEIVNRETPPPPVKKSNYCKNCAYKEFCWS
ncbi:CRISPR-associated protein Cas4 [Thermovibrio sp.]